MRLSALWNVTLSLTFLFFSSASLASSIGAPPALEEDEGFIAAKPAEKAGASVAPVPLIPPTARDAKKEAPPLPLPLPPLPDLTEKITDKSTDKAVDKPAEKPAAQPSARMPAISLPGFPGEKKDKASSEPLPMQKAATKEEEKKTVTEKAAEKSVEKPAEKQVEKPAAKENPPSSSPFSRKQDTPPASVAKAPAAVTLKGTKPVEKEDKEAQLPEDPHADEIFDAWEETHAIDKEPFTDEEERVIARQIRGEKALAKKIATLNRRAHLNYQTSNQPEAIYKRDYNDDNQHLPEALYRSDLSSGLFKAVSTGDYETVRTLLDSTSDTVGDKNGNTVLHVAAEYGQLDTVRMLLARGINPNRTNNNKITPLHMAAYLGNKDIATALLAMDASADLRDKSGKSPADYAVMQENLPVVDVLLPKGTPTAKLDSAFLTAAAYGKTDIAASLLRRGAHINQRDNKGNTPLMQATQTGNNSMVDLLLYHNADVNATNRYGQNALAIAQASGNFPLVERLMQAGAANQMAYAPGSSAPHSSTYGKISSKSVESTRSTAKTTKKKPSAHRKSAHKKNAPHKAEHKKPAKKKNAAKKAPEAGSVHSEPNKAPDASISIRKAASSPYMAE